jgi:hypothetical protein
MQMEERPEVKVAEERRLLVERVAASSYLNRSARLRNLLFYLTDRVSEDESVEIHEQEVGHQVFGRTADYDTATDNIVRVHASMLRKRLDQYFAAEGADAPVLIEIPRGNYAPVFRERSKGEAEPAAEPTPERQLTSGRDWRLAAAAACAILFASSTAVLLMRGTTIRPAATAGGPMVRLFWSQILSPDHPTDVVVDDAAVALYQELTGHAISLNEYFDRSYLRSLPEVAAAAGLDPQVATATILRRQSSFADTSSSWKLLQLAAALNARVNLRFARDYSFRDLKANSAILLGTGRSDPWIQPFEAQLEIRWQFDQKGGVYYPVDSLLPSRTFETGRPGEAHEGYFSIALLPNLSGTGNVLLVSATGGSATNAAADFLANEKALRDLRGQLPRGKTAEFPPFETLVKAQSRSGGTRDVSVVLCRALARQDE